MTQRNITLFTHSTRNPPFAYTRSKLQSSMNNTEPKPEGDKSRSEAQMAAFRANGARSHGPATKEGKAKCGQSNARHGLPFDTILDTGESADEFDRLLNGQIRELEPQTEGELMMIEEMVVCKWNQMRIWAMNAVGTSGEIDAQRENAPEMLDRSLPSRAFRALEETHTNRSTMRAMHRYETAPGNSQQKRNGTGTQA
jgi:hypothetical protein